MKIKKLILPIVMLLLLIVVTVGITFASFTFSKEGTVENVIESSTIMLTYTEGKTGIILNEAYPMSDETGKMLTGSNNVFDFTVTATLGKSNVISYEVSAIKIPITDMTPLEDNEVKLYLERAIDPDTTYQEVLSPSNFLPIENQSEVGSPIGSMILDSGTFYNEGTTIHNYRLKMWVDESAEIPSGESRKYGVKINVYAKQLMMTEESCFTFDSSTGTIADYSDTCSKDVVIPNTINSVTVKNIGIQAFTNNQLTSVVIPYGVTTIGQDAFYGNQLTNINIPNSVISIGTHAFHNNQLIDSQAFIYKRNDDGSIDYTTIIGYGGAKKDNITIPNGVKIIEETSLNSAGLTGNLIIPNSVIEIGYYSFQGNQLTSVTIGSNVTKIGVEAFNNNQLTSLTILDSVASIERSAFAYNQLTNVSLGNNISSIGENAFSRNQLTSVVIPNSVTTIGSYAFSYNQLTNVEIQNGVVSIEYGAFLYNQLTSVVIPNSVTTIDASAFRKELYSNSNPNLEKIINKTGRSFDWKSITSGSSVATFITGVIPHSNGDITVTSE